MSIHYVLVIQILILLSIANMTPVIMKNICGDRMSRSLDGGINFIDGQPIFGKSKTIRGIVSSIIMTTLAASLIGLEWNVGTLIAVSSMAGDLISSFVKRRLRMAPSSMALGLDQIPEAFLPALVARLVLAVTFLDIIAITFVFFFGELILSRLFYAFGLRDRPY